MKTNKIWHFIRLSLLIPGDLINWAIGIARENKQGRKEGGPKYPHAFAFIMTLISLVLLVAIVVYYLVNWSELAVLPNWAQVSISLTATLFSISAVYTIAT